MKTTVSKHEDLSCTVAEFEMTDQERELIDEIRSYLCPIDFAVEQFLCRQSEPMVTPAQAASIGFVIRIIQNGWPKEQSNFIIQTS